MDSETKIKCEAATQQQLSEKGRKLIDDIQEIIKNFQLAWKGGRTNDANVLVEQVLQSFGDLKAEINASSPASPIPVRSYCVIYMFWCLLNRFIWYYHVLFLILLFIIMGIALSLLKRFPI